MSELEAALDWIENGISVSRESQAVLLANAGVGGWPTERAQKVIVAAYRAKERELTEAQEEARARRRQIDSLVEENAKMREALDDA